MDVSTINILTEMGVILAKLALKGTVTSVHNKIEIEKNEKIRKHLEIHMMKL